MTAPIVPQDIARSERAAAGDYIAAIRFLLKAQFENTSALSLAERNYGTERTCKILSLNLKAPLTAGNTVDAAALYATTSARDAFLASLAPYSAYDAIAPSSRQLPLNARVSVTTSAITGAQVSEYEVKPVSALSLTGVGLAPLKAAGQVIVSRELLAAPQANALLGAELRAAVTSATDSIFFSVLLDGISATPSSGADVNSVRGDITGLLDALVTGASSRIFIVVSSVIAKRLSVIGTTSGGSAFEQMTPSGGSIGGTTVLVSDGLPAGTIVALDASQLATGGGDLTIDVSRNASLQADTVGDSPPTAGTVVVDLWQRNLAAVKAERFFGMQRLRDGCVAAVDGVNYIGNSP